MRHAAIGVILLTLVTCGTPDEATTATHPPAFAQLGIVEGFYGPPWSHDDRLDIVRFMGRVGLRDYYYAPKNDPFHLARWRDPYSADRTAELRELADVAAASGVRFHWAISPGGSMVYTDSSEYDTLLEKIADVAALGIEHFGLFLDDVPPTLADERDRARFGTLGAAHAWLVTRLANDLRDRGWSLAVTPTTYTNAFGDREYLRDLADGTPADVALLWTGTDIVPPEITVEDAVQWGETMGRSPLVWDNYPVNDFARWRPFLGPLVGRARGLPSVTAGLLSNPMNEAHASMIPLATIASYGRDPVHYDPAVAWQLAVTRLYGADGREALTPFLELFGDYPWQTNLFEPLFILGPPIDGPALDSAIGRLRAALDTLSQLGSDRSVLAEELRPFVDGVETRLADLRADTTYHLVERHLEFRTELDRVAVPRASDAVTVDGSLDDWPSATWRPFGGPGNGPPPTAAFTADDRWVYTAVRITARAVQPATGDRVGEGDHVAVVVQADAMRRTYLTPDDRWVLIAAPGAADDVPTARVVSLPVEGFMAKYLADNARLTPSEFLLSSFGEAVDPAEANVAGVARRTAEGWVVELALPRPTTGPLRLSLTAATRSAERQVVYGLATRPYPANPATFVELVFE